LFGWNESLDVCQRHDLGHSLPQFRMQLKVALPHDFNQSPNRSVLSQVEAENEFLEGVGCSA
jgi:hypothetical protein